MMLKVIMIKRKEFVDMVIGTIDMIMGVMIRATIRSITSSLSFFFGLTWLTIQTASVRPTAFLFQWLLLGSGRLGRAEGRVGIYVIRQFCLQLDRLKIVRIS